MNAEITFEDDDGLMAVYVNGVYIATINPIELSDEAIETIQARNWYEKYAVRKH